MGKLIWCQLFLLACIAHHANGDDKPALPTFKWANNEGSTFVLNIGFPDGSMDAALLEKFNPVEQDATEEGDKADVDNCILSGKLRDEANVYVSLNGCPHSKNFEITFDSERLVASVFRVVKGVVSIVTYGGERSVESTIEVLPNPEIDLDTPSKSLDQRSQFRPIHGHPHRHCCGCFLRHYTIHITFVYNIFWLRKFGSQSVNRVRQVINMAQGYFNWRSAPLRLTLKAASIRYDSRGWIATAGHLNSFSSTYRWYATANGADLVALMTYENNRPGTVGITYQPAVCGWFVRKGLIVEYFRNVPETARILAHEIAHTLGIRHDYTGPVNRPRVRFDKDGHRCTHIGGFMDRSSMYAHHWTRCSMQDWCYYHHLIYHRFGYFCLACRDREAVCALLGTMKSFFCPKTIVKRNCPRMCGLCNRYQTHNFGGQPIIANMEEDETKTEDVAPAEVTAE